MALVHTVEALEDALLLLGRYADAVILDGKQNPFALMPHVHAGKAAGAAVFYRILAEIMDYRGQQLRYAVYDGTLAGDRELDARSFGGLIEISGLAPCDG